MGLLDILKLETPSLRKAAIVLTAAGSVFLAYARGTPTYAQNTAPSVAEETKKKEPPMVKEHRVVPDSKKLEDQVREGSLTETGVPLELRPCKKENGEPCDAYPAGRAPEKVEGALPSPRRGPITVDDEPIESTSVSRTRYSVAGGIVFANTEETFLPAGGVDPTLEGNWNLGVHLDADASTPNALGGGRLFYTHSNVQADGFSTGAAHDIALVNGWLAYQLGPLSVGAEVANRHSTFDPESFAGFIRNTTYLNGLVGVRVGPLFAGGVGGFVWTEDTSQVSIPAKNGGYDYGVFANVNAGRVHVTGSFLKPTINIPETDVSINGRTFNVYGRGDILRFDNGVGVSVVGGYFDEELNYTSAHDFVPLGPNTLKVLYVGGAVSWSNPK